MIRIENKTFPNEEEFRRKIRLSLSKGSYEKEKIIAHEGAHFEAMKKRGYKPSYGLAKINLLGFLEITLAYVSTKNVDRLDIKECSLAPEDPSIFDKITASKFFLIPYSVYYKLKQKLRNK